MPLYEYKCTECKRHTEKIQKFSDPEITTCPHCGGKLERVISAPAIAFKGGGWYKDGYGNTPPAASSTGKSDGESTPPAAPSGDSASSSSKESAPAAAPAASPAPAVPSAPATSDKK